MLYFLTGNKNKFEEAKLIIPALERLEVDLPEVQSLDQKEIIEAKIKAAFVHHRGEFIVEDTALFISGLNGLPGPLIKWFEKTVGSDGLYKIAKAFNSFEARAVCLVGYATGPQDIHYFEGVLAGKIVPPSDGPNGFGWDPVFQPEGLGRTMSEITPAEKNEISHRGKAFRELKKHLESLDHTF